MAHTQNLRTRRGALAIALGAAVATAVSGAIASPAFAQEDEPAWQSFVDTAPDYLVDTYGLPADHVFETVTFERFEWLLGGKHEDNTTNVTGTFAFLVGGAYDESITSSIGIIDEVAKQYGVEKIYTFDPALDGGSYSVFNAASAPLHADGKAAVQALGTRLLNNYLNKDTEPAFTKTASDPYLFIYDRGHTVEVGGVPTEDRIVASLNVRTTAAGLAEAGALDAYRAQVAAVFDAVAVGDTAQLDALDQWAFWKAEVNRRHKASYSNAATHGDKILVDADGADGWTLQAVTYPELKHLLQQEGDYAILFGGTWCHNTRAIVKQLNKEAKARGVKKVYVFDNSLDSTGNGSTNYLHIRDNHASTGSPSLPRRASYLYGDIWNTYFPNVVTQYRTANTEAWTGSVSPVQFYPGGDTAQPVQLARKGQVPFLIHYNKDNVAGSTPAPVVAQWIRNNGGAAGGGWTEWMIDWWQTPTAGPLSGNSSALAFAAAAESALVTFVENLPGAYEITTASIDAADAGGGAVALTTTVYWCAQIATDAAGTIEFFRVTEAGDVSLGATSSIVDGQASITVSDWAGPGAYFYYAKYTPSSGSDYSIAVTPTEQWGTAIATTLATTGVDGAGVAEFTATVRQGEETATGATGSVEFFRTGSPAVSLGTAAVSTGTASLTTGLLPVSTFDYYAVYTPATGSAFAGSTSVNGSVTVTAIPSELVVTAGVGVGGQVTLTGTVQAASATATAATGSIEFFTVGEPAVSLGTASVHAGVATKVEVFAVGEYQVYGVYSPNGASSYGAATSANTAVEVAPDPVATTLTAGASLADEGVVLTATVQIEGETATAAPGSVEFFTPGEPAVSLGSGAVEDGVATLAVSGWGVGEHEYYAVYTPAEGTLFLGSTSETETVTVPLPANAALVIAPVITGELKVGKTLAVELNPNYPGAVATKWQWYRNGAVLKGKTQATYALVAADRGKQLTVKVTATRDGIAKAATATTPKSAKIGYGTIEASGLPVISGVLKVGERLTATPAAVDVASPSRTYQWYRGTTAISKATKSSYTAVAADLGAVLTVRVTTGKAGYTSLALVSEPGDSVAPGEFSATAAPKISGTAKVGKTLKAGGLKWSTSGVTVRYDWYSTVGSAEPVLIQRSTSASLKLSWLEKGATITVQAVGYKSGYLGTVTSVVSAASALVK